MTMLRVWLSRMAELFLRRKRDKQLNEEIEAHLALLTEDHVRRGLAPDEARAAARRAFGRIERVKESYREQRGLPLIETIGHDFRFATRLLAKERWFTVIAVGALALGIGVNTTQFAIVNALCLRGLPIDEPDRVLYVSVKDGDGRDHGISYPDYLEFSAARAFTGLAAFSAAPTVVGDEARAPDRVVGAYVSANTFRLVRKDPILGRSFRDDDERPGAAAVTLLGSGVWKRRYGGDPAIVGRMILIGGTPSIVIGVMPERFKFPNNADLWQPLAAMPGIRTARRDSRTLGVFGRLIERGTLPQAQEELDAIAARLSRSYPEDAHYRPIATRINERYNGRITDPAWLAFTIVGGLVVVIACANVANLLLMRCALRSREIAVRASLGATRARIVRQLLAESLLLALLGGMAGLGFSSVGVRLFASAIPENGLPYWARLSIDARVFALLAVVCLGTVIIFGLAPALHASKIDVNETLKTGGWTSGGVRVRRWTNGFLTVEFALTVILLAAVVLGVRIARGADRADVAIETSRLITMWVTLPNQKYQTPEARMALYDRMKERFGAIPSVASTSLASALPFGGAAERQLAIAGRPSAIGRPPTVWTVLVDARYFDTIGLPVVAGRPFFDLDGTPGHEVAIVNQRFADLNFPGENPVGHRVQVSAPNPSGQTAPWLTIVGVSPTIRQRSLPDADPIVYLPLRQNPPATVAFIARASSDARSVVPTLREELRALDPNLPLYRVMTMEQFVRESGWNGRLSQRTIAVIACIALLLSAVGLYAVTAYAVSQRMREIGVRMALGAQPVQVVWLVLRRAAVQIGIGLAVGVACAWLWGRAFATGGPRSSSSMTDPVTLGLVASILAVVGALACAAPVRRATRIDPMIVLRHE